MFYFYRRLSLFIYYTLMVLQSETSSDIRQSYIDLSNKGFEFSPFDHQALFLSESTDSVLTCIQKCCTMARCRIFNFDPQTKYCRLYEGDMDNTGSVVASLSPESICGSIQLDVKDFLDHGRSCSYCENSRYLTCINSTCQCQLHTYFDGSICRSQKLNGSRCTNDIECRNDMNLTCLSNMKCGFKTTAIHFPYNSSCVNQTWSSSANRLAQWLFDGSYRDQMNNYNATPASVMSFTTSGYVNQALIFSGNANSMLTAPYIPLASSSFTIDTWLYITSFVINIEINGVFGLCSQHTSYNCLTILVRLVNSNYVLYVGFWGSDCTGVTPLTLNTWIYVAYVFDLVTLTEKIYLNGVLENSCNLSSSLNVATPNTTIGNLPSFLQYSNYVPFQGYIDQMTVSNRVKSSCEILEIATLVAHFTFDNGLFLTDSGPNSLQATTQSTSSVSSGRFSQAITFNGSNSCYFQMSGFTALGISNKSFSISLWLRPTTLLGIVLHVSGLASGWNSWCMAFLGFSINGSFIAQIYNGSAHVPVADPTLSILTSVWSHVVQTWSSTNGLRLYINTVLVASRLNSATTYSASSTANFLTLGNGLASELCSVEIISTLPYNGDMDDFRVYSRELSAGDVYTLYTNN